MRASAPSACFILTLGLVYHVISLARPIYTYIQLRRVCVCVIDGKEKRNMYVCVYVGT